MEAGVGHGKFGAGGGAAVFAVLHIGVVGQGVELLRGQLFQVFAVLRGVLVGEHQRPHQQVRPGGLGRLLILRLGQIVIVREAHGDVVQVLVDLVAVPLVPVGPALVRFGKKFGLMFGGGQ